ncbi:hypothetical protein AYO20_05779 [Fonsecaea nubica]|uniref:non-specific serine/threonine protein kinase n=1 Tax=Fonsecaea nubica TaxID=856822 RepID=A0A178D0W3_9EURO|nr:hypothetical protein AYO20_05779 [Fonsecaea nubica]OAL35064.1 hypothetical protein AYO20_05779 [Fonsecaea nubica]
MSDESLDHVPPKLSKYDWVGEGAVCIVYQVHPRIVVKHPLKSGYEQFHREVQFYGLLKRKSICRDIVECFLLLPNAIFLSYCAAGSLSQRLMSRQIREDLEEYPGRVIEVTAKDDTELISRWMRQLTSAAAFLETMNVAHNDIHPRNLLLDQFLDMKLSDFDSYATVGEDLPGAPAPWARVLADGPDKGSFGTCGPRTEQFAIGSVLYMMLYGHEPYEDIAMDPEEVVERFQYMRFPELKRTPLEDIIRDCWFGHFPSMRALQSAVFACTADLPLQASLGKADSAEEVGLCKELVRSGLLDCGPGPCFLETWRGGHIQPSPC